ncbi:unnamed protein product [Rotaria sp. Silwood2]|nr:unnamed protein product [Rotaria sp. Silwood2]CAF3431700.1 unnamed protein product [Rotaria sp. Silwood2]CAF4076368.1 unnamed protein product [Rotaria sp. Silwood2]CAF4330540.1 unnamed protein product [Rotaria sp. Silwood2]
MSGIYGGVSSIILKQYSKAICIHCVAHCLDLVVHDLMDQCASISNCILCVKDIIDFIRRSPKLQEALYTISEEKGGPGIKANGLYGQINKFDFFFGLKLGHLIFTDTEKLSRAFQSSDCCLQDVFCAAEAIIHRFRRIQDDINFELFYNQVVKDSEGFTKRSVLPRLRQPPRRYQSNTNPVNHASCEDFYQK